MEYYRKVPGKSNNDNSLKIGLGGSFNRILPPPVTAGFHCDCGLLVFKATSELERGDGIRKALTEIQRFFFPNECSLDCCKPLANFQSSKNHNSDNVCHWSHWWL